MYYFSIDICLQPGRCGSLHGRCYGSPMTHAEPIDDEQTKNELFEFEDLTFLDVDNCCSIVIAATTARLTVRKGKP